jgi:hypothetical protein
MVIESKNGWIHNMLKTNVMHFFLIKSYIGPQKPFQTWPVRRQTKVKLIFFFLLKCQTENMESHLSVATFAKFETNTYKHSL